jgi:hypothetical protein
VQEVVDKGFRKQMEQRLEGKVEDKLRQELRDGTLQEVHIDTRRTALKKALVEKELGKMEGEVMMNFARALKEEKTDRYSYKLESRQQWAHRGIEAAIRNAEEAGDTAMANLMRDVEARVFEGDKDQAVKYLIAAGDSGIKKSQVNWKNPLTAQRREAKSMKEDPLPDTRTATLVPTAERLIGERQPEHPLTDLQKRVVKSSLAQVRGETTATTRRPTRQVIPRLPTAVEEESEVESTPGNLETTAARRPVRRTIPAMPTIMEEDSENESAPGDEANTAATQRRGTSLAELLSLQDMSDEE